MEESDPYCEPPCLVSTSHGDESDPLLIAELEAVCSDRGELRPPPRWSSDELLNSCKELLSRPIPNLALLCHERAPGDEGTSHLREFYRKVFVPQSAVENFSTPQMLSESSNQFECISNSISSINGHYDDDDPLNAALSHSTRSSCYNSCKSGLDVNISNSAQSLIEFVSCSSLKSDSGKHVASKAGATDNHSIVMLRKKSKAPFRSFRIRKNDKALSQLQGELEGRMTHWHSSDCIVNAISRHLQCGAPFLKRHNPRGQFNRKTFKAAERWNIPLRRSCSGNINSHALIIQDLGAWRGKGEFKGGRENENFTSATLSPFVAPKEDRPSSVCFRLLLCGNCRNSLEALNSSHYPLPHRVRSTFSTLEEPKECHSLPFIDEAPPVEVSSLQTFPSHPQLCDSSNETFCDLKSLYVDKEMSDKNYFDKDSSVTQFDSENLLCITPGNDEQNQISPPLQNVGAVSSTGSLAMDPDVRQLIQEGGQTSGCIYRALPVLVTSDSSDGNDSEGNQEEGRMLGSASRDSATLATCEFSPHQGISQDTLSGISYQMQYDEAPNAIAGSRCFNTNSPEHSESKTCPSFMFDAPYSNNLSGEGGPKQSQLWQEQYIIPGRVLGNERSADKGVPEVRSSSPPSECASCKPTAATFGDIYFLVPPFVWRFPLLATSVQDVAECDQFDAINWWLATCGKDWQLLFDCDGCPIIYNKNAMAAFEGDSLLNKDDIEKSSTSKLCGFSINPGHNFRVKTLIPVFSSKNICSDPKDVTRTVLLRSKSHHEPFRPSPPTYNRNSASSGMKSFKMDSIIMAPGGKPYPSISEGFPPSSIKLCGITLGSLQQEFEKDFPPAVQRGSSLEASFSLEKMVLPDLTSILSCETRASSFEGENSPTIQKPSPTSVYPAAPVSPNLNTGSTFSPSESLTLHDLTPPILRDIPNDRLDTPSSNLRGSSSTSSSLADNLSLFTSPFDIPTPPSPHSVLNMAYTPISSSQSSSSLPLPAPLRLSSNSFNASPTPFGGSSTSISRASSKSPCYEVNSGSKGPICFPAPVIKTVLPISSSENLALTSAELDSLKGEEEEEFTGPHEPNVYSNSAQLLPSVSPPHTSENNTQLDNHVSSNIQEEERSKKSNSSYSSSSIKPNNEGESSSYLMDEEIVCQNEYSEMLEATSCTGTVVEATFKGSQKRSCGSKFPLDVLCRGRVFELQQRTRPDSSPEDATRTSNYCRRRLASFDHLQPFAKRPYRTMRSKSAGRVEVSLSPKIELERTIKSSDKSCIEETLESSTESLSLISLGTDLEGKLYDLQQKPPASLPPLESGAGISLSEVGSESLNLASNTPSVSLNEEILQDKDGKLVKSRSSLLERGAKEERLTDSCPLIISLSEIITNDEQQDPPIPSDKSANGLFTCENYKKDPVLCEIKEISCDSMSDKKDKTITNVGVDLERIDSLPFDSTPEISSPDLLIQKGLQLGYSDGASAEIEAPSFPPGEITEVPIPLDLSHVESYTSYSPICPQATSTLLVQSSTTRGVEKLKEFTDLLDVEAPSVSDGPLNTTIGSEGSASSRELEKAQDDDDDQLYESAISVIVDEVSDEGEKGVAYISDESQKGVPPPQEIFVSVLEVQQFVPKFGGSGSASTLVGGASLSSCPTPTPPSLARTLSPSYPEDSVGLSSSLLDDSSIKDDSEENPEKRSDVTSTYSAADPSESLEKSQLIFSLSSSESDIPIELQTTGSSSSTRASATSMESSYMWDSLQGPVAHRGPLLLEEEEDEEQRCWKAAAIRAAVQSDEEKCSFESDDDDNDFESMDAEMQRLEEKLKRFEKELGISSSEQLNLPRTEVSGPKVCLRHQDLEELKSFVLPSVYPAPDKLRTKHLSLMKKEDEDFGIDYDSDCKSVQKTSSNESGEILFLKARVKLKPGDRRCRSDFIRTKQNSKDRNSIPDTKAETGTAEVPSDASSMSVDSPSVIPTDDGSPQPSSECITSEEEVMRYDANQNCLGYLWHEDDGMTALDFDELEEFHLNRTKDSIFFIFEDDEDSHSEEEDYQVGSFQESEVIYENICLPQRTNEVEKGFVSTFKSNFKKAAKYLGPKSTARSPIDESDVLFESCQEKGSDSGGDCGVQGFCSSGEYHASPALCFMTSDEDRICSNEIANARLMGPPFHPPVQSATIHCSHERSQLNSVNSAPPPHGCWYDLAKGDSTCSPAQEVRPMSIPPPVPPRTAKHKLKFPFQPQQQNRKSNQIHCEREPVKYNTPESYSVDYESRLQNSQDEPFSRAGGRNPTQEYSSVRTPSNQPGNDHFYLPTSDQISTPIRRSWPPRM